MPLTEWEQQALDTIARLADIACDSVAEYANTPRQPSDRDRLEGMLAQVGQLPAIEGDDLSEYNIYFDNIEFVFDETGTLREVVNHED